jgi:hypothetical protein
MGQPSFSGPGLTPAQIKTFKLSVSAACRKMTADQILDIADQLHVLIRRRSAFWGSTEVAVYERSATDGLQLQ